MAVKLNEIFSPISAKNFTTKCGKKYNFEELNDDDLKAAQKIFTGEFKIERPFQVNGFFNDEGFFDMYEDFLNMKIRDDDVWICSFPRSGTTWTAEMVWCIVNNLDFETARNKSLLFRVPYIDYELKSFNKLINLMFGENRVTVKDVDQLPSPRFFWFHSAYIFLPLELQNRKTNAKIIYALRDPKDVCWSYYKMIQNIMNYSGTFEELCDIFLNRTSMAFGSYWKQVESYLNEKDNPNLFITLYENKMKDLKKEIKSIAMFLGKKLQEEDIDKLSRHLQFDEMKANPKSNFGEHYENLKSTFSYAKTGEHIREGKINEGMSRMSSKHLKEFENKIADYRISFYQ